MAFYVPLGPRGGVFRLGTFLIGVMGSVIYRRASRGRASAFVDPALPRALLDVLHDD